MTRYNLFNSRKALSRQFAVGTMLAAAFLAASCSDEDLLGNGTYPTGSTGLMITVSDGGYPSAEAPQTRAQENGYATVFTEDDMAGLYAVANGNVLLANVQVTATPDASTGSIKWTLPAGIELTHSDNTAYFLYYPYQKDMTGKVDASATTSADEFFQPLIKDWQPKEDQSKYADYTASDLMVAKGEIRTVDEEAHTVALNFDMTHCMVLAVLDQPGILYHITSYNSGTTQCKFDVIVGVEIDFTSDAEPYLYESVYRYIVRPDAAFAWAGSYPDEEKEEDREFSLVPESGKLKAGSYTTFKLDKGQREITGDYHKLKLVRIGDLFCPNASGNDWYLVPQEVDKLADGDKPVGVVFQTDKRRVGEAETKALGSKDNVHGLVMAAKIADYGSTRWDGSLVWSTQYEGDGYALVDFPELTNTKSFRAIYEDISGLRNSTIIKNSVKENELESIYPCLYAVEKFKEENPVPSNTTDWYIPASGQFWDILELLGKSEALAKESNKEKAEEQWGDALGGQKNVPTHLNGWMEKIPETDKDLFNVDKMEDEEHAAGWWDQYWTSTEAVSTEHELQDGQGNVTKKYKAFEMRYYDLYGWDTEHVRPGYEPTVSIRLYAAEKNADYKVRPVLAF